MTQPPKKRYGWKNGSICFLPERDWAYLAIPKAGCTSAHGSIARHIGRKITTHANQWRGGLMLKFGVPRVPEDVWLFTLVRHPIRRAISAWYNKTRGEAAPWKVKIWKRHFPGFKVGMTFARWVDLVVQIPHDQAEAHFRPQYTFIEEFNPVWGKLEDKTFWEDTVRPRTGLGPLPRFNRSRSPRIRRFNRRTIGKLVDYYAQDFEMLGYPKP